MTISKLTTSKKYDWQVSGHFGGITRKPIDMIVLHHNSGTNFDVVPDIWRTREASAHYQVGKNQIVSCLDEDITAWHCGAKGYDNNSHTIGIENVNSTGAPDWLVAPETEENCARLVADIATRYNIPIDRKHIVRHNEMGGTATDCSGGLRIDWVVNRAKQIAGGSTSSVTPPVDKAEIVEVDGFFGLGSLHASQKAFGLATDNIISSQSSNNKSIMKGFTCPVEFVDPNKAVGSQFVGKLQKLVGADVDYIFGKGTGKSWQMFLKNKGYYNGIIDGVIDYPSDTIKAWQRYLNTGVKF